MILGKGNASCYAERKQYVGKEVTKSGSTGNFLKIF